MVTRRRTVLRADAATGFGLQGAPMTRHHSHPLPDAEGPTTWDGPRPASSGGSAGVTTTSAGRLRIGALDVLRGFALCGILLANVKPISHVGPAFVARAPTVGGDAHPLMHLMVDQRFLPIFSLLFGIGFSLLLESAVDRAVRPRLVLLRRLLVLLAIGLVHLLLLWPGDILTMYAVVGLLVLLPSTWLPRWAVAGLAAAVIVASLTVGHGGNLVIPGLFLAGSALVRYGVIHRMEQSVRVPAVLGLMLAAGAVPALWWQVGLEAGGMSESDVSRAIAVAGLLLAGVYVCVLLVLLRTPLRAVLQAVFAPLGRMALTSYLTATILVLVIGRVVGGVPDTWSSTTVVLIAAAVLTVQWVWSSVWLRRYRYGPLEWVWRWATWAVRPSLRHDP
jgi:uncharacterized membrane protein YeiB